MRCKPAAGALAVSLLLGAAAPAGAASFHLGARAGSLSPSGEAYDAVYGDTLTVAGLQAEARFRGERLLVRLAVDRGETDGELVAVLPAGQVVPTGEPTTLTLTIAHLSFGWSGGGERWRLYLGGGPSFVEQSEDSFAGDSSGSGGGVHGVAGGAWRFGGPGGRLELGAEALYLTGADVFEGGAGEALGDPSLGGLGVHAVLSFRLGG